MPVHDVQSASQVAQVALLVAPQAAVWYCRRRNGAAGCRWRRWSRRRRRSGTGRLRRSSRWRRRCPASARRPTAGTGRARRSSRRRRPRPPGGSRARRRCRSWRRCRRRSPPGRRRKWRRRSRCRRRSGTGLPRRRRSVAQTTPLPVKPGLHAQAKLPALFAQLASAAQLSVPVVHSSMSVQPAAPPPV